MVRCIGVLAMTALLVTGTASAQLAAEGGPSQVNADNSEVRERQREVIVTGNVDIVQGMARLRANRVALNYTSNADSTRSRYRRRLLRHAGSEGPRRQRRLRCCD